MFFVFFVLFIDCDDLRSALCWLSRALSPNGVLAAKGPVDAHIHCVAVYVCVLSS